VAFFVWQLTVGGVGATGSPFVLSLSYCPVGFSNFRILFSFSKFVCILFAFWIFYSRRDFGSLLSLLPFCCSSVFWFFILLPLHHFCCLCICFYVCERSDCTSYGFTTQNANAREWMTDICVYQLIFNLSFFFYYVVGIT